MRLLFDQNLSHKLVPALLDVFPNAGHVRDFGLQHADDATIWDFARSQGFIIVTKDADFHQMSFVFGHPPKIVWRRVGNSRTAEVAALIRSAAAVINTFGEDFTASLLVVS